MRTPLFALLCFAPALALDNSKTIYNETPVALTNHPFTLTASFARGEISAYAQPFLTPSDTGVRTTVAAWQNDVRTRWRDGAATRSITRVDPSPATPGSGRAWGPGSGYSNITIASADCAQAGNAGGGCRGTIVFTVAHNLSIGDRLIITGAASDTDLNADNYMVKEIPTASTVRVDFVNVNISSTAHTAASNPGLVVAHVLDPWGRNFCRFTAPDHGFEIGEEIRLASLTGISGLTTGPSKTYRIVGTSRNEFQINAWCGGAYTGSGATATGPDWGSLKFAEISFVATVPASGSLRVDYINHSNPSSAGDRTATRAAGLTQSQMLAFRESSAGARDGWNIQVLATADVVAGNIPTYTADARTMLAAWYGTETYCGPRYWMLGPVVTQIILEDFCEGSLAYDFGWKMLMGSSLSGSIDNSQTTITVANADNITVGTRLWFLSSAGSAGSGYNWVEERMLVTSVSGTTLTVVRGYEGSTPTAFSSGKAFGTLQYVDPADNGFKSLHPSFLLTFYPGWAGVKTEAKISNTYWNKLQTMYYSTEIRTGASLTTRISKQEFKHNRNTYWMKSVWDGSDPEHYCSGSGQDPENCTSGVRSMKYVVDHNTNYLMHSKVLPTIRQYGTHVSPGNMSPFAWWNAGFTNTPHPGGGFAYSDKGDFAVQRRVGSVPGGALKPGLYQGEGTWGADFYYMNYARKDFQNGTQESQLLGIVNTLFAQTWDVYGYDINQGRSVPGGGGNVAVSGFIPWHHWEGRTVNGTYNFNFADPAFGRPIGRHNSPSTVLIDPGNWGQSTVSFLDLGRAACYTTSNANIGLSAVGSLAGSQSCYWGANNGNDWWLYERAHENDWFWFNYLITGHPWYLDGLYGQASWNEGSAHALRPTRGSTGFSQDNQLGRHAGGWERLISRAADSAPTELMWGQSSRPERLHFQQMLWDDALITEGVMDIRDGWASIFYSPLRSDCAGYSSAHSAVTQSDRWGYGRCGIPGWLDRPNALHQGVINTGGSIAGKNWIDGAVTQSQEQPWMSGSQLLTTRSQARDFGQPMFEYARKYEALYHINQILNAHTNPYWGGLDATPYFFKGTGNIFQSWAEHATGYTSIGTSIHDFYASSFGSTTMGIGFGPQIMAVLSLTTDDADSTTVGCTAAVRPPRGCTGIDAYLWQKRVLPNQLAYSKNDSIPLAGNPTYDNPKFNLIPQSRIEILSLTGSSVTIRARGGPDLWWGGACTYAVNPATSLDSEDLPVAARLAVRNFSFVASTGDRLRITCGTARATAIVP